MVAFHIAKDMVPVYTVEKPGFSHMLNTVDTRYQLPNPKSFPEVALPHQYNSTLEKITKKLQDVSFYSTVIVLWSSQTMQPDMSLTAHFITEDWTLQSVCLQLTSLVTTLVK